MPLLFTLALRGQTPGGPIIQNAGSTYAADVQQLEAESVQAFLSLHNLPSTDAALLYQYGRRDLRDELRAWIYSNLQSVIATPASARTPHQQNLYNWFEALVYQNELAMYQKAVNEYKVFLFDPCTYQLDPDIATASNLSYDGAPFCGSGGNIGSAFVSTPTPGEQYFLSVGMKHSYEAGLTIDPNSALILADTSTISQQNVAYGVLAAPVAATISGVAYSEEIIAPYTFQAFDWALAGAEGSIDAATSAEIGIASAGVGGGVGGIVAIFAAIGIEATLELVNQDENNAALASMQMTYNSLVQNCNSVDLNALLTDKTGVGNTKLMSTFLATTLPDAPSSLPLPTRTEGVDPIWGTTADGATQDSITYTDWQGSAWSVQLWGNYLLQYRQTCVIPGKALPGSYCSQNDSFGVSIRPELYVGPSFCGAYACLDNSIYASRIGSNWLIANPEASGGTTLCPVGTSGLSVGNTTPTSCKAFVSNTLTFAPTGAYNQTWSVLTPPVFNTNGQATFVDGNQQSIVLLAREPNSSLQGENLQYSLSGPLPPHFSTSESAGALTLVYDGIPDPSLPGTYNLNVSATLGNNGTGAAPDVTGSTPVAITVRPGDAIQVRSNTLAAYVGDRVNYQIYAAGGGANTSIQLVGVNLPPGLSFQQRGGLATISGVALSPGASSGLIQTNYGATNPLTVSVTYRQSPAFITPSFWAVTDNVAGHFQVDVQPPTQPGPPSSVFVSSRPFPSGFVSNVSSLGNTARPLSDVPWLTVQNRGAGLLLYGTPPSGSGIVNIFLASVLPNSLPAFQTLQISASDQPAVTGSNVIVAPNPGSSPVQVTLPISNITTTPITITSPVPTIISGNVVTITPGVTGLVPVMTYLTAAGTTCGFGSSSTAAAAAGSTVLPASMRLASQKALASSTAASAAETSGSANSDLVPFQTFYIEVDQKPSILSPAEAYFSEGINNNFSVTTSGFPEATAVPNSTSPAKPMRVTLTGNLPAGVSFNDLSPTGLPTGTGKLSGTPTETGKFPVTITADNGVGSPATQDFTLVVNVPGDVNGDGQVSCEDIAIVKAALGSYKGQANFDARADLNHDDRVNILDLSFVAARLPAGTRCQ